MSYPAERAFSVEDPLLALSDARTLRRVENLFSVHVVVSATSLDQSPHGGHEWVTVWGRTADTCAKTQVRKLGRPLGLVSGFC